MNSYQPQSPPDVGGGKPSSGIKSQAQDLADEAKRSAESFAEQRKSEGADRLHDLSGTASRVADEVEDQSPAMADFVRKAADSLDGVSRDLKNKSVGELLDYAKSFARREPAAFLAASAAAGFALSRILKSSAPTTGSTMAELSPNVPPTPGRAGSGAEAFKQSDVSRPLNPARDAATAPKSPGLTASPPRPIAETPTPSAPPLSASQSPGASKPGSLGDRI